MTRHPSASPAFTAIATATRLSTGRVPGMPRHKGRVDELGASPKLFFAEEKIFERVSSCACTSRPITG